MRFLFTDNQDILSWWLNDAIVKDYMQLINFKAMENGIKAHCYNSVFTSTFENQGYRGVKKWSEQFCKNHKVKSLFGMERLIFPINVNNNHWAFMAVFLRKRNIVYYDSLSNSGNGCAMMKMSLLCR